MYPTHFKTTDKQAKTVLYFVSMFMILYMYVCIWDTMREQDKMESEFSVLWPPYFLSPIDPPLSFLTCFPKRKVFPDCPFKKQQQLSNN